MKNVLWKNYNRLVSPLITVIIPVYNAEKSIGDCILCLRNQNYDFKCMEIILINDGSTDDSEKICRTLTNENNNIIYIEQDNLGVSAARNLGIKYATGKYIFFLDADDLIASNTIKDCVRVFKKIDRKTDLLTYPIETHYKGRVLQSHFRYKYLTKNGIYDLRNNAFIGQTTMNIVVKNRFEENILFDESISFSEDQKYCWDVAERYHTMGFCKTAKYIYNRSEESSSGRLSGSCYIFEPTLKMFEELFTRYRDVPMAFQGLFVNDMYWKIISNIYFPYHYNEEKYSQAMERVKALLRRCYNSVIMDHPNIDYFEKFYLMKLKGNDSIQLKGRTEQIEMYSEGNLVFKANNIEIVITKVTVSGTNVRILGFLKSSFFQFYQGEVKLTAVENGHVNKVLKLSPSVHNYYLSHEATQNFFRMEYECDIRKVRELDFKVKLGEVTLPVSYYFMPLIPFSKQEGYDTYEKDNVYIQIIDRTWQFSYKEKQRQGNIWLYYDCKGVEIDNGLQQFVHDAEKRDGVERYYVVSDKRQQKYLSYKHKTVEFGSNEHKQLLLQSEKVITAFIENNNILPFSPSEYDKYSNFFKFETIYLQHGVLHIDMPWKYSPEKIMADKVIVSCNIDHDILSENGFSENDLWKVKMPRFDFLPKASMKKKKILFAPSWRSYLVGNNTENTWELLEKKLISSRYFLGLKEFIESEFLYDLLVRNDYVIDIKLHPIFQDYKNLFKGNKNRVKIKSHINIEEYSLFITDFSSFMFDFLYMDIPVLSFIPDYEEFTCGMNGYRKVDFMNKIDSKEICKTSEEIIEKIELYFKTGRGMPYKVKFYGEKDGNSREAIYNKLISD